MIDHSRRAAALSTGPPSLASTNVAVSSWDSGCSSSRGRCPSFHNAVTASGAVSPVRSVSTTLAARRSTSWCTTTADSSSNRCASSTPTTTPARPAPASNASLAWRTNLAGSGPTTPNVAANAPNGNTRADAVATAHRVSAPRCSAAASASRANRVLPTPAGPASTTPAGPSRRRVSPPIRPSSSTRPVNGHPCGTPEG